MLACALTGVRDSDMRVQIGLLAIRLFNIAYALLLVCAWRRWLLRGVGAKIGKKTGLHDGVRFTWPGRIDIGDNSTVNLDCFIDSRGYVRIGSNTMIGHRSSIYTMTHLIDSDDFASKVAPVVVGNNVVIFPHVLVMPGVVIGDNAIVYPGSVVTKSVDSNSIVAGVPAKKVGIRNGDVKYTLDYCYSFANS